MGSAVHHVGPLGSGALTKLATNTLQGIQVTMLAEIIGMIRSKQADTAAALRAVAGTSVWAPDVNYLAGTMQTGDFRPQYPVELTEMDFGYTVAAAGGITNAPGHCCCPQRIPSGNGAGHRRGNMASVVKLFTTK